ncbi:MAG: enoyl-CoA hydratase/isomerase family protein [Chloroflexi bacterium]|nr:enoyl-CoA hydratase/isomerase family protein [Chloroflexota bacterium]
MAEPFVLVESSEGIGWITLNEPARLNPVTVERVQELNDACLAMSRRDDVRVVIVTGAGRGFSSGADLSSPVPEDLKPTPGSGSILEEGPGLWTLTAMRQPVIAMVNGPAVGYGAELAIQADIRVAGQSARFRLPFSRLGTVSDTGAGSWLLPRLIGWAKAAELLYTSRFIDASEAKAIGLVNHVVPDAELRSFTTALAREIAENSAKSLIDIKRMLFAGLDERKREHLVEQYFRFRDRNPDAGSEAYTARFRR